MVNLTSVHYLFQAMFRNNPELNSFQEQNINESTVNLILDCARTGSIIVNESNSQELLIAAQKWQLHGVEDAVCQYLEKITNANNFYRVYNIGISCNCARVQQTAFEYAFRLVILV